MKLFGMSKSLGGAQPREFVLPFGVYDATWPVPIRHEDMQGCLTNIWPSDFYLFCV